MAHHVVWLVQTSTASPSQWEGKTSNGLGVYIRYRYHGLYILIGTTTDPWLELRMAHVQTADPYGDAMYLDELKALTSGLVAWPK